MKRSGRRRFLERVKMGILALPVIDFSRLSHSDFRAENEKIFFTTGFKVMEVGQHSALIWTRLCAQEKPNPIVHERREAVFRHPINFDEQQPVDKMDGGVKGAHGFVRFKLSGKGGTKRSDWLETSDEKDFTASYVFEGLATGEVYNLEIEGRATVRERPNVIRGRFRTIPPPETARPVNLVTSTCQYFWSFDDAKRGFRTYDSMRKLKPDFYIHTGDYIYYDKPGPLATNIEKARHKWHAMDSWPSIKALYEEVPLYMIKDDHDLLKDDAYREISPYGELTFEGGLKIWYENVPLPDKPYRTIRWGKDLQIWMVEGREFRSANTDPDGEQKSIWGAEQKNWFTETVEASDATFKLLFTATPVVGPDRESKRDNHANSVFETEGNWLREYLSRKGMFIVNGDRHWQYVSRDSETGLMEFGSGPVSDYHAQGWDQHDVRPEHQFLRVKGGFLQISVERIDDQPFITFIHRDVDGNETHQTRFGG